MGMIHLLTGEVGKPHAHHFLELVMKKHFKREYWGTEKSAIEEFFKAAAKNNVSIKRFRIDPLTVVTEKTERAKFQLVATEAY